MLDAHAIRSRSAGPIMALDPDQVGWQHLELPCAIPHPWFVDQLARALGVPAGRLAQPEPRGWRERALDEIDRTCGGVDPSAWLLRVLPVPPADQRGELEAAYARVVAASEAVAAAWTPERERTLATAIARLFGPSRKRPSIGRRVLGREDRLSLGAWVPDAVAASAVPDPELALDEIGLPDPLARAFDGVEQLLVVIRAAPACDAVLRLRTVVVAGDDAAVRLTPLLLAAIAERAEVDACELELVLGRGHGLDRLGPLETVFARPFAHGLLVPGSVAQTLLSASFSRDSDELGDRRTRARMVERLGWIADLEQRRARLERAQRLLAASLDDLTREGSSLCIAELSEPLGDPREYEAVFRAIDEEARRRRDDGLYVEIASEYERERVRWTDRRTRELVGHYRVWDAPEGVETPPGKVAHPSLRAWASMDPETPRRLLVGPDTERRYARIMPRNLVNGLDTHTYFAATRGVRTRVRDRILRPQTNDWQRAAVAALRPPPEGSIADCGSTQRESAAARLVRTERPTLFPWDNDPPIRRPLTGVLACGCAWVCERCWAGVAAGQGGVRPDRAALELVRLFGRLHDLAGERRFSEPYAVRSHGALVADSGRIRLVSPAMSVYQGPIATLEIHTDESVRTHDIYRNDRVLVTDGTVLTEPTILVQGASFYCFELDGPLVELTEDHVEWQAPDGSTRWGHSHWFDRVRREFDYFGVTGKPFGYALIGTSGWSERVHAFAEWRVLLGESALPKEVLAPFAGRLTIRRLDSWKSYRFGHRFRIEAPAVGSEGARVWTADSSSYHSSDPGAVKDGSEVHRGEQLAPGFVDAHELAARDADESRWWALEVLLGLSLHARAPVDWRALELYARLATSPRGHFASLTELAHSRGDLLTRMRLGSMFEALRSAVIHGPEPLRDPISEAFAARRSVGSPAS